MNSYELVLIPIEFLGIQSSHASRRRVTPGLGARGIPTNYYESLGITMNSQELLRITMTYQELLGILRIALGIL